MNKHRGYSSSQLNQSIYLILHILPLIFINRLQYYQTHWYKFLLGLAQLFMLALNSEKNYLHTDSESHHFDKQAILKLWLGLGFFLFTIQINITFDKSMK